MLSDIRLQSLLPLRRVICELLISRLTKNDLHKTNFVSVAIKADLMILFFLRQLYVVEL